MMELVGIMMVYLIGVGILTRISLLWSWKELLSLSFLLGIAVETFFMFVTDAAGFQFSTIILFFASFAVVAGCYDSIYAYWEAKKKDLNLGSWSLSTLHYPAVLLGVVLFYLFYIIMQKNLYWPTTEHDAIGSFDKLGIVMALEGKIKISLFKWDLQGAGGIYPPLFHGGIAYLYLFGAVQPKIITTLFFASMLLFFYASCRRYVSSIGALIFTLMLEMVPELYSHAALLLGNLPTTAYVGSASLALFVWLQGKEQRYFIISCILIGLCLWIRNDTIGFAVAGVAIIALFAQTGKKWRDVAVYAGSALLPFIVWTLYLKFKIQITQGSRFVDHFGFNVPRLKMMLHYVLSYFSWIQYGEMPPGIQLYGLAFMLPIVIMLLNYRQLLKERLYIIVFLKLSFIIYFLIFYAIDEQKQGASISSLMESSFKRGMFCFIPPMLFYAATCTVMKNWLEGLERWRKG